MKILHSMVEPLYLRHLAIQDLVLPGALRLDFLGGVERSKTKFLSRHRGVADVKPSPLLVLDIFGHRKGEEKKIGFEGNDAAPNGINTIGAILRLHGIEFPEEAKVQLDTEPALTEHDETGDMKKRVWRMMMKLYAIKKKQ